MKAVVALAFPFFSWRLPESSSNPGKFQTSLSLSFFFFLLFFLRAGQCFNGLSVKSFLTTSTQKYIHGVVGPAFQVCFLRNLLCFVSCFFFFFSSWSAPAAEWVVLRRKILGFSLIVNMTHFLRVFFFLTFLWRLICLFIFLSFLSRFACLYVGSFGKY